MNKEDKIVGAGLILRFDPRELIEKEKVFFDVADLGLIVDAQRWPDNLVLNKGLIFSDDMFSETMSCDSTLIFYIRSAIGRVKSLISRATHNPHVVWEHGLINIFDIGKIEEENTYMTRTKTVLSFKAMGC